MFGQVSVHYHNQCITEAVSIYLPILINLMMLITNGLSFLDLVTFFSW